MHSATPLPPTRHIMWQWRVPNEPGLDHLQVQTLPDGVHFDGFVIGVAYAEPFRLRYHLECDTTYQFQRAELQVESSKAYHLTLVRDASGAWHDGAGTPYPELSGCTEIDIEVSPVTNTLPIRRLGLKLGESAPIQVAYILLPTLEFAVHQQEYTRLPNWGELQQYRYQSTTTDFQAEVQVDAEGLVVEYPDLWRRVW